jgi:polyadenylate-binding protein
VQFEKPEEAQLAIETKNKSQLNGKEIEVMVHEKREQRKPKFNNLFVKGLPVGTTDADLIEMFKEFGEIESAVVKRDQEDKLSDAAFVCYKDPIAAEAALTAMNKKSLPDGSFLLVN